MWSELGAAGDGEALRDALLARYAEAHRHYHTRLHLVECFDAWAPARALALRAAEVEIALWFHDAIYRPLRSDNELRSAEWAERALLEADVAPASASRVRALVLATRHDALPLDPDQRLLVDVDLAILGADEARFAEYERQIRAEYAFVPSFLFRRKRREILGSLLDRPTIYGTSWFRERLEPRARDNLQRAVGACGDTASDEPTNAGAAGG
jgi:predicted metal-dependent HD superfamily phosphohydrolase